MKILVDIVHMADVNFYRNAIEEFRKRGHKVIITCMKRGNLPSFVKSEFKTVNVVGSHSKNKFLKPFYNLMRVAKLRKFIKEYQPNIVTSFSYYPAAASRGLVNSVIFHDDPEYKMQFRFCRWFADKLVIPDFISVSGDNIRKYHSYKEWAYLKDFKPSKKALKKYKIEKDKYIFIRDIASVSLNYSEEFDFKSLVKKMKKAGYKIVVSLEDKSRKKDYKGCVILEEPEEYFHSLVYYAKALVSSGDTMVREAALLGVPAYYTGGRAMEVNDELIKQGYILPLLDEDLIVESINNVRRKKFQEFLEDTTEVIVEEVLRG